MLAGLEAPVDVLRDRFGVPHVRARTPHDVTFALGFCHAQDRLWQLEFFRRATAGRLSEFAGEDALAADRLMRTLGMRRVAEREARELSPAAARPLRPPTWRASTPRSTRPRALPIEFQLLRLEPEPWNTVDLLAAAKLMGFGLSTNWEMELLRARHRAARRARTGGPARAAVSARQPDRHGAGRRRTPARGATSRSRSRACAKRSASAMHATGSNNWVVSGERSVTGKPLLACDPHLTFTDPGPLVRGRPRLRRLPRARRHPADQPVPGVRPDRARAPAGFTNVMADTQDLFVERLNADDARMYEFEGDWREAEVVREEIQVKGRSATEALDVTVTHHGPIVSDVLGADEPLALSWTGLQYPLLTESGYDMARARNGEELLRGGGDAPRSSAQHAVGGPRRQHRLSAGGQASRSARAARPDLPKPGWTGEFEWDGTIPYEELPAGR